MEHAVDFFGDLKQAVCRGENSCFQNTQAWYTSNPAIYELVRIRVPVLSGNNVFCAMFIGDIPAVL